MEVNTTSLTFQRGKMKPDQEKCISTFIDDILSIEPRNVTEALYADEIINHADKQIIDKKPSRKERADELVTILLDRGPRSFDGFIRALNKARYLQLASDLKNMASESTLNPTQSKQSRKLPIISITTRTGKKGEVKQKDAKSKEQIPRQLPSPKKSSYIAQETDQHAPWQSEKQESGKEEKRAPHEQKKESPERTQSRRKPTEHDETKPDNIKECESKHDKSKDDDDSKYDAISAEIYASVMTAHNDMKNQVDNLLDVLQTVSESSPASQKTNIEKIKHHMQKAESEKTRLENGPRERKIFNRDMVILIVNMKNVLSCLSDALVQLAKSLKDNDEKYQETINKLQGEIDGLKKQLEERNEQLHQIERDRCAERQAFVMDMRAALAEREGKMFAYFQQEKEKVKQERENEQHDREKDQAERERDREERQLDKQRREKDKQKVEEVTTKMEKLKLEIESRNEREDRRSSRSEVVLNDDEMMTTSCDIKEADAQNQHSSSREVFLPRTQNPSLPVRGTALQRQSRESRK